MCCQNSARHEVGSVLDAGAGAGAAAGAAAGFQPYWSSSESATPFVQPKPATQLVRLASGGPRSERSSRPDQLHPARLLSAVAGTPVRLHSSACPPARTCLHGVLPPRHQRSLAFAGCQRSRPSGAQQRSRSRVGAHHLVWWRCTSPPSCCRSAARPASCCSARSEPARRPAAALHRPPL